LTRRGIFGEMDVRAESKRSTILRRKKLLTSPRSPADITERLDRLIRDIRERWQAPAMSQHDGGTQGDVLIVAHGHILRAFAQRWAGKSLQDGPTFLLDAGGVGTLRYDAGFHLLICACNTDDASATSTITLTSRQSCSGALSWSILTVRTPNLGVFRVSCL